MSPDHDAEDWTTAAHVLRDGKITLTLVIKRDSTGWYTVYPEDGAMELITQRRTLEEATRDADYYMAGFIHGYDEGAGSYADEAHTGHSIRSIETGSTVGYLRRRGRGTTSPDQHRDRADGSGASEGEHPG